MGYIVKIYSNSIKLPNVLLHGARLFALPCSKLLGFFNHLMELLQYVILKPRAPITFRIVSNVGLRSPESAL